MLIPDASGTNRVSLGMKCGDCTHLEKGPAAFEKLCSQLGKTGFSAACNAFTPDYMKITVLRKGELETLAKLVAGIGPSQMKLFAYAFRSVDFLKKAGFQLGQEVVFSIGGDYLDCFVRGSAWAADPGATQVYIISNFENLNGDNCFLTLMRTSVFTLEAFKKKRKQLIADGRVNEPKPTKSKKTTLQCLKMTREERADYRKTLNTRPDDYVPPTLDTVDSNWLDNRVVKKLIDPVIKKEKRTTGVTSDAGFKVTRYTDKPSPKSRRKPKGI